MVGWRASLVAVVVAGFLPARAGGAPVGSPRRAAESVPLPPRQAGEAVARWTEGSGDRAVAEVRRAAQEQLGLATRELGRQDPFDWDEGSRRAAAYRLDPAETSAALALQQAQAAEPVSLSRAVEELARAPRRVIEEEADRIEAGRREARASCREDACAAAADRDAERARAQLLERMLSGTTSRWELLRLRVAYVLADRLRLAERVATSTSDPFLLTQAKGLVANSWRTVVELATEVERETALAVRLSKPGA